MDKELESVGLKAEDIEVLERGSTGDRIIDFVDRLTDASTIKTDNDVTLTKQTLLYGGGLILLAGVVFYIVKKSN